MPAGTAEEISPLTISGVTIRARVYHYIVPVYAQFKAKFIIVGMSALSILTVGPAGYDTIIFTIAHYVPAGVGKSLALYLGKSAPLQIVPDFKAFLSIE